MSVIKYAIEEYRPLCRQKLIALWTNILPRPKINRQTMKREIKFRAWASNDDYPNGKMYFAGDDFVLNLNGDLIHIKSNGDFNYSAVFARVGYNDINLMQFTGLKDKNGKEIYEGDIVKWEDTIDDGYGCGYLTTIREIVTFGGGAYNPISTMPSKYFEVIGNIYENPELLKS